MDVCTSLIENGLISAKLRYSKENNAVAIVGLGPGAYLSYFFAL